MIVGPGVFPDGELPALRLMTPVITNSTVHPLPLALVTGHTQVLIFLDTVAGVAVTAIRSRAACARVAALVE